MKKAESRNTFSCLRPAVTKGEKERPPGAAMRGKTMKMPDQNTPGIKRQRTFWQYSA